ALLVMAGPAASKTAPARRPAPRHQRAYGAANVPRGFSQCTSSRSGKDEPPALPPSSSRRRPGPTVQPWPNTGMLHSGREQPRSASDRITLDPGLRRDDGLEDAAAGNFVIVRAGRPTHLA